MLCRVTQGGRDVALPVALRSAGQEPFGTRVMSVLPEDRSRGLPRGRRDKGLESAQHTAPTQQREVVTSQGCFAKTVLILLLHC